MQCVKHRDVKYKQEKKSRFFALNNQLISTKHGLIFSFVSVKQTFIVNISCESINSFNFLSMPQVQHNKNKLPLLNPQHSFYVYTYVKYKYAYILHLKYVHVDILHVNIYMYILYIST